jgi:hypothetical protein
MIGLHLLKATNAMVGSHLPNWSCAAPERSDLPISVLTPRRAARNRSQRPGRSAPPLTPRPPPGDAKGE